MTGIYILKIFDNFVAYTDVGEGRGELGAEALKILFSNILYAYLLRQN